MSVTVTIAATSTQLTTLDTLKAELGIADADTTDDDVLDAMIDRASSAIADECGRVFGAETVTETRDGSNTRLLGLARTPILTVTSVLEDDVAITDYSVEDAAAGALYRQAGWGRSGGLRQWGTDAYASGYILPGVGSSLRYTVTYQAGYALPSEASPTLPGLVEQACLETVKTWVAQQDGIVADPSAVRVGSLQVQYRGATLSDAAARLGLPLPVLGMLRQYRRVLG